MDLACQAPLSMGFLRQEYWRGLPFPTPGDIPDPGTELLSPISAGRFLTDGASLVAQLVESACNAGDCGLIPGLGRSAGVVLGFSCGSAGKESAYNGGHLGSTSGLGRSPGEEKGYPLQSSGLENCMD